MNNCQDPSFSTRLRVDYYFEKVQKLKLGVYDIDNKSVDLTDDDFLGGLECTLGQVGVTHQYLHHIFDRLYGHQNDHTTNPVSQLQQGDASCGNVFQELSFC